MSFVHASMSFIYIFFSNKVVKNVSLAPFLFKKKNKIFKAAIMG